MKVLHLPTPVGGNAWGLSRGERALGLESDVLYLSNSWIQYPADRIIFQNNPIAKSINLRAQSLANRLNSLIKLPRIIREINRIRKEYDIFHFNFGSTLLEFPSVNLSLVDLPIYAKKGKIVVTYNGCDARQKYPTMKRDSFSPCHDPNCYNGMCIGGKLDKIREKNIKKFDRYADAIFALNPDLFYFLPERTRFLPYTIASWDILSPVPEREIGIPLTIVHAPTNRGAKGTEIILKTLKELQFRYRNDIEVKLVENRPYSEALNIYASADLIIDQILIGWYGGLAVEAMKMGIPVMAYINEEDLQFIPSKMAEDCLKTIINVTPKTIYDSIESIIQDPVILKAKRQQSLKYVNRWHDPVSVARITKEVYES